MPYTLLDYVCDLLFTHKEKSGASRQKKKKKSFYLHYTSKDTVTQWNSPSVLVSDFVSKDHAKYAISHFSYIYMGFLLLFILMLFV